MENENTNSKLEKTLEDISVALAEKLLERVSSEDVGAAELNMARQMLKDNNITVSPKVAEKDHPIKKLAVILPFEGKEAASG